MAKGEVPHRVVNLLLLVDERLDGQRHWNRREKASELGFGGGGVARVFRRRTGFLEGGVFFPPKKIAVFPPRL